VLFRGTLNGIRGTARNTPQYTMQYTQCRSILQRVILCCCISEWCQSKLFFAGIPIHQRKNFRKTYVFTLNFRRKQQYTVPPLMFGRPLIKVVTLRNIADDLLRNLMIEANRLFLPTTFNDFSSSRLLIAIAENCKFAVPQHNINRGMLLTQRNVHSACIASQMSSTRVHSTSMMTVLTRCKSTDRRALLFVALFAFFVGVVDDNNISYGLNRGRANTTYLIRRPTFVC